MAFPIIMPKTGMAMLTGVIMKWFIVPGDKVARGTVIAEIETDKAVMELESDQDGTVLAILFPEGSEVAVTETIAWVGAAGETLIDQPTTPSSGGNIKHTPAALKQAASQGIDLHDLTPSGTWGEIRLRDVITPATPLARRQAQEQGIDVSKVSGSGIHGKVFNADVLAVKKLPDPQGQRVRLTAIQKITGSRMLASTQTIPSVTTHIKADLTDLLKVQAQLNQAEAHCVSLNAFIMLAVAKCLVDYPRLNSVLDGDEVVYQSAVNLGMAVASPKGLLVPVIHQANTLGLKNLSTQSRLLASAAREGRMSSDQMEGGTFTVSNLGMFGTTWFTPIINPPQVAILGVCAIEDTVKLVENQPVVRKMLGLSLSYDHRVIDGAGAAEFLQGLSAYLESPLRILI